MYNMFFTETANLVLKHADIDTDTTKNSATSSNGSYWTNGKQKTMFKVNLKKVLGKMWEEYDEFVLRLNQFSIGFAAYAGTVGVDNQFIVNLSGLNFKNATYYQPSGNNQSRYQMHMVYAQNNLAQTITYAPNVSVANFYKDKSRDEVELTFELLRMIDNQPVVSGNTEQCPHMCWIFDIYPVKSKK